MDQGYDLFFEILTKAFNAAGQAGVTTQDAFPALIDFAAMLGMTIGGEDGAEAMIDRIQRRAHQWKDGGLPVQTATLH